LHGRTDTETRAWLGETLKAIGLDPAALDSPSPYEMPDHTVARGAAYDAAVTNAAPHELAAWFADAHTALTRVREQYTARGLTVSPVRCWPHHFDIATLVSLEAGDAEHARSVNAGLSPGDGSYAEPYFYVSPWPYPDLTKLPPLPKLGHWHTQGFLAAVAPAGRIVASGEVPIDIDAFLHEAIEASIKSLS
jgi:hypothetical protein